MASQFTGQASVLGYELQNEPFNPSFEASDKSELLPLYQALHRAIRAVDNQTILFYEPHVLNAQYFRTTDFPFGGPGGPDYNDRQAFSYHVYCFNTTKQIFVPLCEDIAN